MDITPFLIYGIPAIFLIMFPLCMQNMSGPIRIFKGCISNKEFNTLMDVIFEDSNLKVDEFRVQTPNYSVWIANAYYGFTINEVRSFSYLQKKRFFKRVETHRLKKALLTKNARILYAKTRP